jgi:Tol biopolymer transport system component
MVSRCSLQTGRVAFARIRSATRSNIYIVPAAGGEARRVTSDGFTIFGITWEEDGRSLVFGSIGAGGVSLVLHFINTMTYNECL